VSLGELLMAILSEFQVKKRIAKHSEWVDEELQRPMI
jgi:hypothetical protein